MFITTGVMSEVSPLYSTTLVKPILSANRPLSFLTSDICALVMLFTSKLNGPETGGFSGRNFWKSPFSCLPSALSRLVLALRRASALVAHSPYTESGRIPARRM